MEALAQAPEELTSCRLRRLGEGVGKVVYASEHWVVKRERSPAEVLALIAVWRILRKLERMLPLWAGRNLVNRPARQIHALRVVVQALMMIVPRGFWFTTHLGDIWKSHRRRDLRGERLAREHLQGTELIPQRVTFPPTRVRAGGWPGWLIVREATERVDCTLHARLSDLARAGRMEEIEAWLNRFLEVRKSGWKKGLFSVDAHLKNFGVSGERIVLLDTGGLTNRWEDIDRRLAFEDVLAQPHIQLGLGPVLGSRPEIAARFDDQWKKTVNREEVRRHWPEQSNRVA